MDRNINLNDPSNINFGQNRDPLTYSFLARKIMNDHQTLQQGIAEFHKKNQKYFSEKSQTKEGDDFLKCHDAAHVVFGCGTTLYGEGLVKIWTTFGTDLNFWEVIKGYRSVNAYHLAREFSFSHVAKNIFILLLVIPKVIYRTKRMKKPWPFKDYAVYLNTPIHEIREAYNIQVV